jgi:DNA-binding IclR family transcriptional regulator
MSTSTHGTAHDDQAARRTALGRALAVLDAFGPQHRLLSLSEIARRADLTLPTTHRLVNELVTWGALERHPSGHYFLGLRLLELAALAPRGLQLREAAFPFLDDLHQTTHSNVHLGVRDGHEVVYVDAMRSRVSAQITSRVGDRWPLHVSGTGLALLAYSDPSIQEEVLRGPLRRYTPETVVDPHELRRRLADIRRTGIVIAHNQISMHAVAVAAPVRGPRNDVIAAISAVVATNETPLNRLAAMITDTAHSISRALGASICHPRDRHRTGPDDAGARHPSSRWADPEEPECVVPGDVGQHRRVEVHGAQRRTGLVLAGHGREVRADQQPVVPEQVDEVAQRPPVEHEGVVVEAARVLQR